MKRKTAVVAACVVAVFLATFWLLWASAQPIRKARALLADLESLPVGKATFDDAQRLSQKHGGFIPSYAPVCTRERCDIGIKIENTLLKTLHLAPRTDLGATLKIENGLVWYIGVGMGSGDGAEMCLADAIQRIRTYATEDQSPFRVSRRTDGAGRPWKLSVWLTEEATPAERKKALTFHLDCLSKIGGCKNAAELHPMLWSSGESSP